MANKFFKEVKYVVIVNPIDIAVKAGMIDPREYDAEANEYRSWLQATIEKLGPKKTAQLMTKELVMAVSGFKFIQMLNLEAFCRDAEDENLPFFMREKAARKYNSLLEFGKALSEEQWEFIESEAERCAKYSAEKAQLEDLSL